ncbi:succinate dehydrogenase, cytochrome b556 subunit [Methylomonas paludis]|uniref:Succinate dehydrogenase cytochrome b556 subunit n=1 Tax=Methylomonas paludis TaxID=1173101 RepID=A0A975MRG9_9GAMM|nr:succinate dehydrogenase, cytochrome b556 subunit [Methylomonas paludis]QWF72159.1 succinate dehydrogenase, cytochrome b556 subunit [Methylomonas paludis]
MPANNRPLSPHLQVYRLPLTGLISITHRITGVLLCLGLLGIVAVLYSIAAGVAGYAAMQSLMSFWLSQLVFWGFIYALLFHICHGIRHLIWDAGKSFELLSLQRYAVYELIASLLLTVLVYSFF